jgi:competence protein ComEC
MVLGPDLELKILYPLSDFSGRKADNLNNTSVVAKLNYKDKSILFTGDIEIEAEEELLEAGVGLQADFLKAAHHGSRTSSSLDFLQAVSPDFVFISVGDNDWGQPNLRVMRRMERMGATVWTSKDQGGVKIVFKPENIEVIPIK